MVKKITKDIVNERLSSRSITLVGYYTNSRTKTIFKCSKNHEWTSIPNNVMRGQGCPICSDISLTKDIVNERLSSRNIELIGDYTNRRMKSLFKCSESHVWEAVVGSVIYGGGCPYCSNKVPLTKDIVNTRVSARNIKLIGDYINNSSKTLFRCDEGHEWNASPHHIMEGSGCPSCAKHGFKSDKPGTIYVLHYKSLNCIKYGISNNFDQRFTRLSYQGDCDLLHKIDFPIGKTAQDIERRIKKELGGSFLSKHQLSDGWTETLHESYKDEIFNIINSCL